MAGRGSGTYTSQDLERAHLRTARSDRSAPNSHLEICSRFFFGFFVSYLDFCCPVWRFSVVFWIFCVLFGDLWSHLEIFSRFMEIFVADWRVSGQGTVRKAGKRAAP